MGSISWNVFVMILIHLFLAINCQEKECEKSRISSVLYPYLYVMPVDYTSGTSFDALKKCFNNTDCSAGTFCGTALMWKELDNACSASPPKVIPNGHDIVRHCYPSPFPDKGLEIMPSWFGRELKMCDTDEDCENKYEACFEISQKETQHSNPIKQLKATYAKDYIVTHSGVCAKSYVCDPPYTLAWSLGTNTSCKTNQDCAVKNDVYEGECRMIEFLPNLHKGVCCYKPLEKCHIGFPTYPPIKCFTNADCNLAPDGKVLEGGWSRYCDEEHRYCCFNPSEAATAYCPDGKTFLYGEDRCTDYDPSDVNSGSCSQSGAICRYGHCCPGLTMNEGTPKLGAKSYVTNVFCYDDQEVPNDLRFAYCDGRNIVVIGAADIGGFSYTKNDTKMCKTNSDCVKRGLAYCVRESEKELYCYRDPFDYTIPLWMWILLIVGVVIIVIVVVLFCIIRKRKNAKKPKSGQTMKLTVKTTEKGKGNKKNQK